MYPSVLKTKRLILRRFTPQDLPALFQILSDREVNRFLPWDPVNDLNETRLFYEERYAHKSGYCYAICLCENNLPIGYIDLETQSPYELGYGLCKEFWGQGIVTEAGRALIEQARQDSIPYITATHDRNNPASGRVMQKLGMQYRYSYEEQWQPKNFSVIFRMYQKNLNTDEDFVFLSYWNRSSRHMIEKLSSFPHPR